MTENENCCEPLSKEIIDELIKKASKGSIAKHFAGTAASRSRLAADIACFNRRLGEIINKNKKEDPCPSWAKSACSLLNLAKESCDKDNFDLGWRCLDMARSFSYMGLNDEEIKIEARAILNEVSEKSSDKIISKWRSKTIADIIGDKCCNLQDKLNKESLFCASLILNEAHHNNYYKNMTLMRQYSIFSVIAVLAILALIPLIYNYESSKFYLILSVIIFGVIGATVSSILSVATGSK